MKQPIPFGKYYLLERINVGGMAEVFKAKATGVEGFERLVAVKRILPGIAEDEEFVTMFIDEAKIAVQLAHANIAQIFDLGRVDGSFFIALEYVRGKDLRAVLNRVRQRGDQLPIPLSCFIIMKLCEGLDYAHNKHDSAGHFLNLVHRDVSPQNILVSYEGEVKIVDFGIAKAAGKAGRTQAGILKGKFGYMSPEQVQGVEIDRRSDVFGVGICLYELLTGERPFAAETDFATLEKVRVAAVEPPSTHNPRVAEELEQIVLRALAKDRDARYPSALALHDALQAFMHTSGNLFSRKDLGLFMHRVFADEIAKENESDAEFTRLTAGDTAGPEADAALAESDLEGAQLTAEALTTSPDELDTSSESAAKQGAEPAQPAGDEPGEIRRRTGTLLGVPYAAALHVPSVPRPVPGPGSIPPLSAAAPSSRPPQPSRPSLQAVAPELEAMDWDDEELSTQIYDKPGSGDDDLSALSASVPDSVEPGAALIPTRASGAGPWLAPRTSEPPPSARGVPPMAATIRGEPARPVPASRSRPMLSAVIAVLAIIVLIVLGLVMFRPSEPGTVSMTTRPTRVEVSVDGRGLGASTSPFVIGELTADRPHEIVVSSPGHAPWTKVVTVSPGQVLNMPEIKLEPIETGFVLTTDPAEASVFVDDRRLPGRTPLRVTDIAPGDHRLRVELDGYASWESTLNTVKGTVLPLPTIQLQVLPKPEPSQNGSSSGSRGSWRRGSSGSVTRAAALARPQPGDLPEPEPKAKHDVTAEPPPEPSDEPEELAKDAAQAQQESAVETALETAEALPEHTEQSEKSEATSSAAEATQAAKGKLRVNSRPWSEVFVDGKSYGATPRLNIELSVGSHTLRLVNDEFHAEKSLPVEITAGKTQSVVVNLLER